MKILVISDSHGYKPAMLEAVRLESPNLIVHLGDHSKDCTSITLEHPNIPVRVVRGNCDRSSSGLDKDEFQAGGKRFFISHGNLYGVKTGLKEITRAAAERGADVLLFGHTHIPYYCELPEMTIINPGSIGVSEKSYAVLELKDGAIKCDIKTIS